jgi:hypothetical protein
MGRTQAGNLWRFRCDLPADLQRELEQFCFKEPVAKDLAAEPRIAPAIRAALHAHSPLAGEARRLAYWIP